MIDELVVEACVIVSALELLSEKLYGVKFADIDDANKVIAQVKCLTVYAEIHSNKLDDLSIGEDVK